MKKVILILFVPIFLTFSATYYLSNDGNNGNLGTSELTPWRTISTLDSALFYGPITENDIIKFRKDDTFYGQINLYSSSVPSGLKFSSYPETTGEKPIINGATNSFYFDKDDPNWDLNDQDNNDSGYVEIGTEKFYFIKNFDLSNGETDTTEYRVVNLYAGDEELIMARTPNEDEIIYNSECENPSYTGFYYLPDPTTPNALEFPSFNGGEFVVRNYSWKYAVSKLDEEDGSLVEDIDHLQKNAGYFFKNHRSCLDDKKEWFYNYTDKILYFSADLTEMDTFDDVWIYPVAYDKDDLSYDYGFGFNLYNKSNITIENLEFKNMRDCINIIGKVNDNFLIKYCDFRNSVMGINCCSGNLLENSEISGNNFSYLQSAGIYIFGNSNIIGHNSDGEDLSLENKFSNIGLKVGYDNNMDPTKDANGVNLTGIELRGTDNIIGWNHLNVIGNCAIRFLPRDEYSLLCNDTEIMNNTIDSAMCTVGDGGGIYTWHNWG
ncbi:MAG: hypothetical protein GQ534_06620, partial [Candidatus Delongbacteria bacterium]|nr:hypothetical protein [Candidatus Delongbacteria bacterium]